MAPDLDPALMAKAYADGGAAALSVLTDATYFGGSADDLVEARAAVDIPVLRKDFTVCAADVRAARAMGADAVLLIVAVLSDAELRDCNAATTELGMDALFEIHDEAELERALAAGAGVVGVNQRDLHTFEVDHDRALRMAALIPKNVVRVAESGVRDATDATRLHNAGYDAVLVGQSLVTANDPSAMVRSLRCS
jgi:indole-3-glycerol phosphate synthase